jgi:hypothetical protein
VSHPSNVTGALHTSPSGTALPDFFEAHIGLWAMGSALAAMMTVFVSAVGLYFIWAQVRASREALADSSTSASAAAAAARTAYASTRPWIKLEVSRVFLTFNPAQPGQVGCQIDYRLENIGKTPAIEAGIVFKPLPVGYGVLTDVAEELRSLFGSPPHNPRVLFPGDVVNEALSTNFPFPPQRDERFMGFKVVAAVVYKAEADGPNYWTPVVLSLQQKEPPPDRVYRFYRGMGHVECLVIRDGRESPNPT